MAGDEQDAESQLAFKLFTGIQLDENVAKNAVANKKFRAALIEIINDAGAANGCSKPQGNMLYTSAGKYPANALCHRPFLLSYVMADKIKTVPQLEGAFEYLKKIGTTALDTPQFEDAAGVGVLVTETQIKAAVADAIKANEARLIQDRYHFNVNILLGPIIKTLKWAEASVVKTELEAQVMSLLGPKTEADLKPPEKKKKPKAEAAESAPTAVEEKVAEAPVNEDPYAAIPCHNPADNNIVHTTVNFSDGRIMRIANTPAELATHLKATGGRIFTRFPPEPNGYLHIGHAKAMFVDFGMAEVKDGLCYLRYDDTNPEAEKLEYIQHIEEIIEWMGWKPWKITYSSDYFDQLLDLAVQLIKGGNAYVCHQTKEEIEEYREKRLPSPWRDRPIEESLRLFEDMKRGLVDEGKATLRMRMDHQNENYNMFDLIAYRIKFVPHPHIGDKYVVYPSYDYTHCIIDSLENITHSLCTLEFESRRASYYWLLEVLNLYKPVVWEYARLNITNMVMSKRKLNKLVTQGYVNGWDDPRLLTLAGLRRRGVRPAAINSFIREIGITRNANLIHMHKLEYHIRQEMDANVPRVLCVLRPLKVVLVNLAADHQEEVQAKLFPGRDETTYSVPFTRVVYLEETDFKEKDEKGYYGLAPGKSVMLRYAYPITCTGFKKDESGKVVELEATVDRSADNKKPPKGVLNWVAEPRPGQTPLTFEARLYEMLFKSEEPDAQDNWLEDMNPASLQIVKGGFASPTLAGVQVYDRFQFERLGFFSVDPDSRPGALVFNRTVTLKESFPKQTTK